MPSAESRVCPHWLADPNEECLASQTLTNNLRVLGTIECLSKAESVRHQTAILCVKGC